MNQEEYETEKARRRAFLGVPVNASREEALKITRQGLLDRGFTEEQIDAEFRRVAEVMKYWEEYDAETAKNKRLYALKEEQKRARFTVGDDWYYIEDAVPWPIESPLDSMRCENDDIPIGEAVANNGGRFFVCNLDLLDAEWLEWGLYYRNLSV